MASSDSPSSADTSGTWLEVFITFLKLGCTSFGGPVAHLGYFHKELVERRRWLSDAHYAQLLAVCQFLPGPASSQLGFALGLTRAGWRGAISAFVGFTLPSALVLFVAAGLMTSIEGDWLTSVIHGLKLVAVVIVTDAVWGMAQKLCQTWLTRAIALMVASGLLLMTFMDGVALGISVALTQILMILLAAVVGFILKPSVEAQASALLTLNYGRKLGSIFLLLFTLLLLLTLPVLNQYGVLVMARDFYQAGALVFGGGHVVLPLLESSTVAVGHLTNEAFLAGYGAAQAVPGPLFTFAAYLGALVPAGATPALQALVAIMAIFLPGFLLLLGVLPFWAQLSEKVAVRQALVTVNAAVVGLLLATLVTPVISSSIVNVWDLAVAVGGLMLLRKWHCSPLAVVFFCVVSIVLIYSFT
ncbi:chromate efflux transporter [Bacterioplanoides sp. SCSIO 12839]|nr:chromate efflux transporter [Bacterioplanoides sp. SCSIO 12839]